MDNGEDALVGNAADAAQVRNARRREKDQRKNELLDLKALLGEPAFRRFAWRMMGFCRLNQTVFTSSEAAVIAYNSGKQDVAHFLLSEITSAQPEAFLQMMQEHAGDKI